jgi:hypothetical protein
MEKLHRKMVDGFSNYDVSPAVLSYKMLRESRYVNESLLQYLVSYVNLMSNSRIVPEHLKEIQDICQHINISLQELGLVGDIGGTRSWV